MFSEGGCASEHENSQHLDDWPDGFQDVPGPGVWIWEGDMVWTGGASIEGEEWDVRGEGTWRRPNAVEAWRVMRGEMPFPVVPVPVRIVVDASDVRDGEPRHWCIDRVHAERIAEKSTRLNLLHGGGFPFAVVARYLDEPAALPSSRAPTDGAGDGR